MKKLICTSTKFALLLICVLGLAACGDEVYYTDDYLRNSDEKLCGKVWTEEYVTDDNMDCIHQLRFAQNRSGQEIFQYYRSGESRPASTVTFNFSWEWLDEEKEGLLIDLGANEIFYFENVWVRQNYLSGMLDGREVTFRKE